MSGWYIMRRGWMEGFKPEPFTEREAFLWSIEQAAWEDHDQWFNGHRIAVKRGEFVTSLRAMADAFGWTVKRVRGLMERLGKAGNWAQRPAYEGAQAPTVLCVVNYSKYQELPNTGGTASGTAKGTRGAQQGHSEGTQQNLRKPQETSIEEESPSDSSIGKPIPSAALTLVPDDIEPAFVAYQQLRSEFVPNARPLDLPPARRKKLAARLREVGGRPGWDDVLARIRGSPFLRGETERFAFATIDWLLKPENLLKVREGNFDERRPASADKRSPVRGSPIDALGIAIAASGLGR